MKVLLLVITNIILSILILIYIPAPFVWIAVCWFVVFLIATIADKRSKLKPLWFNIGFLILALGCIEAYLWIRDTEGTLADLDGYITPNDILGYAPSKNKSASPIKYNGEDVIYDVTYSIDSNGLRISPSSSEENQRNGCVLFFGGSFTFGEGVNDNEAMPYIVGKESKYTVYNFAFHGYGPHQMLSALEHGVVKKAISCQPKFAIYQTIFFHIKRSAGYSSWDQHGPRYVLQPDGTVKYEGHFDDESWQIRLPRMLDFQLEKSFIYRKFFQRGVSLSEDDINLFIGIINTSAKIFFEEYPEGTFQVIFWDADPISSPDQYNIEKRIMTALKTKGIHIHLISDIIPDIRDNPSMYSISHDGHPNALAHKLIADYVLTEILDK